MNQYEFTPEQNQHIDKLRWTLCQISMLMFGIGFLLILIGHYLPDIEGWITILAASLFLVLAVIYFHPLINFKRVTTTSDDDINQMLQAMDNLQTAFSAGANIAMILSVLTLLEIFVLLV